MYKLLIAIVSSFSIVAPSYSMSEASQKLQQLQQEGQEKLQQLRQKEQQLQQQLEQIQKEQQQQLQQGQPQQKQQQSPYNTHVTLTHFRPSCPVIRRALKANQEKDFYSHTVSSDLGEAVVISYFNHRNNTDLLGDTFVAPLAQRKPVDLRAYELSVCKQAMATLPRHIKHRGKLCFAAGMLVGAPISTALILGSSAATDARGGVLKLLGFRSK